MLGKLTNNVTLCYKLGGKFTSPGLIRCIICTGISTLYREKTNYGFPCFCIKTRVICEDLLWCIFMSLWPKRFQWFPTGHFLENESTMSAPAVSLPSDPPMGDGKEQVLDLNIFSQNIGTTFKETQTMPWGSYNELLESKIPRWIPGVIIPPMKYKRLHSQRHFIPVFTPGMGM